MATPVYLSPTHAPTSKHVSADDEVQNRRGRQACHRPGMSVQHVLGLWRQRTRRPLPERRGAFRHAAAKHVNSHSAVGGGGDEKDTARVVPRAHNRHARNHVLVHVHKLRRH